MQMSKSFTMLVSYSYKLVIPMWFQQACYPSSLLARLPASLLLACTFVGMSLALTACGGGGGGGGSDSRSNTTEIDGGGEGQASSPFGTPDETLIRPGVRISGDSGSCTSNFIYQDPTGNYYIGVAAHCFSPDTNRGVNACETRNEPLGNGVTIENADHMGTLVYSSWRAMQANGENVNSAACAFNDFSLVRIDSRDNDKVHPSAIAFGGPTGLLRGNASMGDDAHSYGQSSLHQGVRAQEEKSGEVTSQNNSGWQYQVQFDNTALSGDSGSAVLHETGKAFGVLTVISTSVTFPPVDNGVLNLEMALDYANDFLADTANITVGLVTWSTFYPDGDAP